MDILRTAARTMLASYFVINGAKKLRNPDLLVEDAEDLTNSGVSFLQNALPTTVSKHLPESPKTWVRINGCLQLAGGIALATGVARRIGAGVAALSMAPDILISTSKNYEDPTTKKIARKKLLNNIALTGAALLAAQDTEGKPGIVWRAKRLERKANRQWKSLIKENESANRKKAENN